MTKKPEQSTTTHEEAPGEFPVRGYEPLDVPKGFSLTGLLERLEKLESEVVALKSKAKV